MRQTKLANLFQKKEEPKSAIPQVAAGAVGAVGGAVGGASLGKRLAAARMAPSEQRMMRVANPSIFGAEAGQKLHRALPGGSSAKGIGRAVQGAVAEAKLPVQAKKVRLGGRLGALLGATALGTAGVAAARGMQKESSVKQSATFSAATRAAAKLRKGAKTLVKRDYASVTGEGHLAGATKAKELAKDAPVVKKASAGLSSFFAKKAAAAAAPVETPEQRNRRRLEEADRADIARSKSLKRSGPAAATGDPRIGTRKIGAPAAPIAPVRPTPTRPAPARPAPAPVAPVVPAPVTPAAPAPKPAQPPAPRSGGTGGSIFNLD